MGRVFAAAFFSVALALYAVFTVLTTVTPLGYLSNGRFFESPCDFNLRMTEIDCLKKGVNPFDVWNNDVVLPPYKPNWNSKVEGPEFTEGINAYAPWEYTLMMPFSFIPRRAAWAVYWSVMMLVFVLLLFFGRSFALKRGLPPLEAFCVSACSLLLTAYPAWSNIAIGNFSLIVLAAVVMMIVCLEKKMDVAAGFCWALAMVKPQIGLLFAVPLLMKRRYLVCFTAASTCFVASLLPAFICGVSPFTLILQTPAANTFMFSGCGTLPWALCGFTGDVVVALAVGAAVCFAMTRALPRECPLFVFFMPAAVTSAAWTYVSNYGHVMAYFFFLVLAVEILCVPSRERRPIAIIAALSVVFCTRLYNAVHGFLAAYSCKVGLAPVGENCHRHFDSLNSTLDLLLAAAFVFIYRRRASASKGGIT